MYSPPARQLLEVAGWSPTRKVDLECLLRECAAAPLNLNEAARNLLSSLYGIRISVPVPRPFGGRYVLFDPVAAFDRFHNLIGEPDQLDFFNELAEGDVSPIGETDDLLLLMRGDGATFGVDDAISVWFHIGNSAQDTIERLCDREAEFTFDRLDLYGRKLPRSGNQ